MTASERIRQARAGAYSAITVTFVVPDAELHGFNQDLGGCELLNNYATFAWDERPADEAQTDWYRNEYLDEDYGV